MNIQEATDVGCHPGSSLSHSFCPQQRFAGVSHKGPCKTTIPGAFANLFVKRVVAAAIGLEHSP